MARIRDKLLAGEPPLTARSVIASALLGSHPPRLPASRLVRAGSLFGIAEGAIRTALSRMTAAGEVVGDDGIYRLTGRLLERQRRIDDSLAAERRAWDRTWELAVVSVTRRPAAERAELRTSAVALRLGVVREGVWARPSNLDPARLPGHRAVLDSQCLRFSGASAPDGLVADLFDLAAWARRADQLDAALGESMPPSLDDPAELAAGFVLAAAVLRHLQADPLLPDELLPTGWPGRRLRRALDRFDAAYTRHLFDYLKRPG